MHEVELARGQPGGGGVGADGLDLDPAAGRQLGGEPQQAGLEVQADDAARGAHAGAQLGEDAQHAAPDVDRARPRP